MTTLAECVAASVASTEVPSEQKPCSSGGETLMRTASSGMSPEVKRSGTSWRKVGTYSARPSFTAALAFGPMNSALCRMCPTMSGARWGPGPSTCRCTTFTSSRSRALATRASRRTEGAALAAWTYT
jgi:hypothetical protein